MSTELNLRRETLNLWNGLEELEILHLSDLHLPNSIIRLSKVKEIILSSNAQVIMMTGDYVDNKKSIATFTLFVTEIASSIPIYYVLGNHDKRFKREINNSLSSINNCFNVDELSFTFNSSKGKKYIISSWKNRNNKVKSKDERHIVLMHNPKRIEIRELNKYNLVLAGHLHGGQFIFRRLKNGYLFPACLFYKFCFDSKLINGTLVSISRGLGDLFPFRFNCPYEIINYKIK